MPLAPALGLDLELRSARNVSLAPGPGLLSTPRSARDMPPAPVPGSAWGRNQPGIEAVR